MRVTLTLWTETNFTVHLIFILPYMSTVCAPTLDFY
jgi:hypothetical protein